MIVAENRFNIDFELWGDERAEDRRYRSEQAGAEYTCTTCGRPVNKKTGKSVEVVDGGRCAALPNTATEKDDGYMGFWVLGPECAKKFPKPYLHNIQDWM